VEEGLSLGLERAKTKTLDLISLASRLQFKHAKLGQTITKTELGQEVVLPVQLTRNVEQSGEVDVRSDVCGAGLVEWVRPEMVRAIRTQCPVCASRQKSVSRVSVVNQNDRAGLQRTERSAEPFSRLELHLYPATISHRTGKAAQPIEDLGARIRIDEDDLIPVGAYPALSPSGALLLGKSSRKIVE
jgi:hypothetical protein